MENIGHDGSGVHCGNSQTSETIKPALATKKQINWQNKLQESPIAVEAIKHYYKKLKKPFIFLAINKLARLIGGKK